MCFNANDINLTYINALADLVAACKKYDVEITTVKYFMNGFLVLFEVEGGDAFIHDGAYGRMTGEWETIGFPWDYDDVSCHDAETLAQLLAQLKQVNSKA